MLLCFTGILFFVLHFHSAYFRDIFESFFLILCVIQLNQVFTAKNINITPRKRVVVIIFVILWFHKNELMGKLADHSLGFRWFLLKENSTEREIADKVSISQKSVSQINFEKYFVLCIFL